MLNQFWTKNLNMNRMELQRAQNMRGKDKSMHLDFFRFKMGKYASFALDSVPTSVSDLGLGRLIEFFVFVQIF